MSHGLPLGHDYYYLHQWNLNKMFNLGIYHVGSDCAPVCLKQQALSRVEPVTLMWLSQTHTVYLQRGLSGNRRRDVWQTHKNVQALSSHNTLTGSWDLRGLFLSWLWATSLRLHLPAAGMWEIARRSHSVSLIGSAPCSSPQVDAFP